MREFGLRSVLVAAALALSLPGVAIAHNTYVDRSDGDDGGGTNDCSAKAHPCATLGRGIGQAGAGDTVFVGGDPAPFTEPQELGDGKSIVQKDFSKKHSVDTSGKTVLDTGADSDPALEIVSDAGKVKGLTIRSLGTYAVQVDGAAKIMHDRFDEEGTHTTDVAILGGTGSVEVTHDTFKDTTPLTSEGRFGVVTSDTGEVLIAHNQFKGLATGIGVGAGAPAITDNRISGSHVVGMFGNAVSVSGGGPSMTGNEITNPDEPPMGSFINGVLVIGSTASLSSTNDLIQGFSYGIETQNAGTLTIDSDVILDSSLDGIGLIDGGSPDAALGNANATNLTVTGSGLADVEDNAHLDLDSSVAGDDGIDAFGSGSCTITNSRGPAGGGPSGCHSFSVNSNPKLKADGYHLKASSPMIDAGNPAPPSGGALDIDGDKRALDGTGNCNGPKQRDIGADEFRC